MGLMVACGVIKIKLINSTMHMKIENEDIVKITSEKLCTNTNWRIAYKRYADGINENKTLLIEAADYLNKFLPKDMGLIRIYSSINLAQKSSNLARKSSVKYDLRIYGQSVATLIVQFDKYKNKKVFLKIDTEQESKNETHLKIKTPASPLRRPYEWESTEAQVILSTLISFDGKGAAMHSEEHKLETLVLSDLAKKHIKDGKKLPFIRPVILGGLGFFQMRTPFGASNHNSKDYPKYSMRQGKAASGGGIDILARIQHDNGKWRLAVIELKDGNDKKEPQPLVMQQALVYATFIAHLLRDESCGNSWYNIFRNRENEVVLKEETELHIDVITMMPPIPFNKNKEPIYDEGKMDQIIVPNIPKVILHPSTIYIDAELETSKIKKVYGSLIDDKRKV